MKDRFYEIWSDKQAYFFGEYNDNYTEEETDEERDKRITNEIKSVYKNSYNISIDHVEEITEDHAKRMADSWGIPIPTIPKD